MLSVSLNKTFLSLSNLNNSKSLCFQAGSYNLQLDNVNDGCTPCDCDPGGAVNPDCNVVTGQCTCRQNIMGRDCREPFLGRYIPKLDHLTFDVEFQKNEVI